MYSPQVIEHFEHPRNVGEVEKPSAAAEVENPACGDVMRLSLRLVAGRIAEARFRTQGCVTAIACGSALTEMLAGRGIQEAQVLKREELVAALGGLSNETMHASHLAMDALRAALRNLGKASP